MLIVCYKSFYPIKSHVALQSVFCISKENSPKLHVIRTKKRLKWNNMVDCAFVKFHDTANDLFVAFKISSMIYTVSKEYIVNFPDI